MVHKSIKCILISPFILCTIWLISTRTSDKVLEAFSLMYVPSELSEGAEFLAEPLRTSANVWGGGGERQWYSGGFSGLLSGVFGAVVSKMVSTGTWMIPCSPWKPMFGQKGMMMSCPASMWLLIRSNLPSACLKKEACKAIQFFSALGWYAKCISPLEIPKNVSNQLRILRVTSQTWTIGWGSVDRFQHMMC